MFVATTVEVFKIEKTFPRFRVLNVEKNFPIGLKQMEVLAVIVEKNCKSLIVSSMKN